MHNFNISPEQNYKNTRDGRIFTGRQLLNLLEIAKPETKGAILLSIMPTEEPATDPDSKYGVGS